MATNSNKTQPDGALEDFGLTPQQLKALELMFYGRRQKDIAVELGVSEGTVSRWRQQPAFQAARNAALLEVQEGVRHCFHELSAKALEVVTQALTDETRTLNERLEVAWKVLAKVEATPVGQTDAAQTEAERKAKDAERQMKETKARKLSYDALLAGVGY